MTMTIREAIEKHLDECALDEGDVKTIVDEMKAADKTRLRWSEPISSYPSSLLNVLFATARMRAKKWLKEHKPDHVALMALEA